MLKSINDQLYTKTLQLLKTFSLTTVLDAVILDLTNLKNTLVTKYRKLTIGGTQRDLSADRIWYWTPYKNPIEAGETITIPENYQQIIKGTLVNRGTIINYGTLFNI